MSVKLAVYCLLVAAAAAQLDTPQSSVEASPQFVGNPLSPPAPFHSSHSLSNSAAVDAINATTGSNTSQSGVNGTMELSPNMTKQMVQQRQEFIDIFTKIGTAFSASARRSAALRRAAAARNGTASTVNGTRDSQSAQQPRNTTTSAQQPDLMSLFARIGAMFGAPTGPRTTQGRAGNSSRPSGPPGGANSGPLSRMMSMFGGLGAPQRPRNGTSSRNLQQPADPRGGQGGNPPGIMSLFTNMFRGPQQGQRSGGSGGASGGSFGPGGMGFPPGGMGGSPGGMGPPPRGFGGPRGGMRGPAGRMSGIAPGGLSHGSPFGSLLSNMVSGLLTRLGGGNAAPPPVKPKPEFCREYDCPPYTVLRTGENFELRRYEALTYAAMEIPGSSFAKIRTYWTLAAYVLQGKNEEALQMPLTVPILTKNDTSGRYMYFLLPYLRQSIPPIPKDPRVKIVRIPAMEVFVRPAPGYLSDQEFQAHADALAANVSVNNTFMEDVLIVAGYDTMFKFRQRYNEIWLVSRYLGEEKTLIDLGGAQGQTSNPRGQLPGGRAPNTQPGNQFGQSGRPINNLLLGNAPSRWEDVAIPPFRGPQNSNQFNTVPSNQRPPDQVGPPPPRHQNPPRFQQPPERRPPFEQPPLRQQPPHQPPSNSGRPSGQKEPPRQRLPPPGDTNRQKPPPAVNMPPSQNNVRVLDNFNNVNRRRGPPARRPLPGQHPRIKFVARPGINIF